MIRSIGILINKFLKEEIKTATNTHRIKESINYIDIVITSLQKGKQKLKKKAKKLRYKEKFKIKPFASDEEI